MTPSSQGQTGNSGGDGGAKHERRMYLRFGAMIATSTVVMFGLMYLNTYAFEHVRFSETRLYMALLMGACMAIIMLAYMQSMYPKRAVNIAIFAGAIVVFAGALFLVQSQATIEDRSYMRAMIPHHSIAVLTSERSGLADVRVIELADGITKAQRKEILEMKWLIEDISRNGPATTQEEAEARPVPDYSGQPGR